jgi:lycopene cyclase domain-containing protein
LYTYLLINFLSILVPFAFSFDKRLNFYQKWKYIFPAILLTAIFFLIWDSVFTGLGVWGFNPHYTTGITIVNLPLEEFLFFFCIPYACMFTYEVMNYFFKIQPPERYSVFISTFLLMLLAALAIVFNDRLYTFYTSLFTITGIVMHLLIFRISYIGRIYRAYLIILLPFLLVNGILTGTFIDEPVVWYNDEENLSVRLFTIPVEDVFYGFLLFLMNVSLYERFRASLVPAS